MNATRMGTVLRLVGIGWYVAICIGGGVFAGVLLDRQFGFSLPILTLTGLGFGLALAIIGMFRMLMAVLAADGDSKGERKA